MIKILIISAVLVIVSSVNLRTEAGSMEMLKIDQLADDIKILKGEKVLVQQDGQCVVVYSQCNYQGQSASSCNDQFVDVKFPIYSAKVPDGKAISVVCQSVTINIWNNVECLKQPINLEQQNIRIASKSLPKVI